MKEKINIRTNAPITWCPGCTNFSILSAVQKVIENQVEKGKKREEFAIVTGIGCHAKLFDYLGLPGINTLHGRVAPTCLGIKLARPELTVLGFSGDGDAYSEGIEHLMHIARYNPNFKYIIHNNRVFALTLGQPAPTTEIGYTDPTNPQGVKIPPFNPIKLMLNAGASFVARVFADVKQVENVLEAALAHKGFAFIEVIQPCIVFHPDAGIKDKTYSLEQTNHDKSSMKEALTKAEEFDYNNPNKIPLGIFYQKERECFEEKFSKLKVFKDKKMSLNDVKR